MNQKDLDRRMVDKLLAEWMRRTPVTEEAVRRRIEAIIECGEINGRMKLASELRDRFSSRVERCGRWVDTLKETGTINLAHVATYSRALLIVVNNLNTIVNDLRKIY